MHAMSLFILENQYIFKNGGEFPMKNQKESIPRYICPIPDKVSWKDGEYVFGSKVICNLDSSLKGKNCTEPLRELWSKFTLGIGGIEFTSNVDSTSCDIVVKKSADLQEEGYELSITNQGIRIGASCTQGLVHAWCTLMQLIYPRNLDQGVEKFVIPYVEILDKPALKFRGLHLCVFPETTLTFLEKSIRMAGLMKYSHIVLEFWGTLESDVMAERAWLNYSYTKEEIRPLIDIANGMGMEVIPMFNCLGHASSSRAIYGRHVVLDQNPRKALLFEPDGWTWCLSNPETRQLLREIRQELMELCGEGEYFHLGFDEAYSYATCDLCREKDGPTMLAEYLNEVTEELAQVGRRPIIWGDALLDQTQWSRPNIATSRPDQRTHEALDGLNRSIIIADWQYNIVEGKVPTSEYFMEKGFDTLLCPWHDSQNINTLGLEAQRMKAYGLLATTWHTLQNHITLIPRAGEVAWSDRENKDQFTSTTGIMRTYAASLQRKLVPIEGDYKAAGWHSKEVEM